MRSEEILSLAMLDLVARRLGQRLEKKNVYTLDRSTDRLISRRSEACWGRCCSSRLVRTALRSVARMMRPRSGGSVLDGYSFHSRPGAIVADGAAGLVFFGCSQIGILGKNEDRLLTLEEQLALARLPSANASSLPQYTTCRHTLFLVPCRGQALTTKPRMATTSGEIWQTIRYQPGYLRMRALILMYHKVAEPDVDPWSLCVSPERFSEHMDVLRRVAHPCAMRELISAHTMGNIPENAVAVTFDDGYADNLTKAKPILEALDVPATVFVCSGAIGQNEEFWWDQLGRVFLQTNKLIKPLVMEAADQQTWSLANLEGVERNSGWGLNNGEFTDAFALSNYMAVWKTLRPLPAAAIEQSMRQIRAWAGIPAVARPTHRTLSVSELATLASGRLIEIGAHSVSHALLPAHSREVQCHEIMDCRNQLEDMIQRPVEYFAYPYGEYDQTAVDILHEAGFTCACTTVDRAVTPRSKVHELPRVPIRNWSGEQFLEIVQRKLSDHDVMPHILEAGEQIAFSLKTFNTQTGDLQRNALVCMPQKHVPGHCLYGPDYIICHTGTYRALFTVSQELPEVPGDVVLDVYENRRTNSVLAEAQLDAVGGSKPVVVEFFAKQGYSIELRVYWRGRSRFRVDEIRLERLT